MNVDNPMLTLAGQDRLAAQIATADAMSLSLLFAVERQYLDTPFARADFIRPGPRIPRGFGETVFLRVKRVGRALSDSPLQPLTALQTALTACHYPGAYTLVFIVSSDGQRNEVFWGVQSHNRQDHPAEQFVSHLAHFLKGNWPGTQLEICYPEEALFQAQVTTPLAGNPGYMHALTGIPSLKAGDAGGYPQSLDRLMRGLRGRPFTYMAIAEPLAQRDAHDIVNRARALRSTVHLLQKLTLGESATITEMESFAESASISLGRGQHNSQSNGTQFGFNAGWLTQLFPPAALLGSLGGNRAHTTGISEHLTRTTGISHTHGLTKAAAQSIGREIINTHAVAAEQLLGQVQERFEMARAVGSWDVGIYLWADQPFTARRGADQLRALLSGGHSRLDPIRLHHLRRDRVWSDHVRPALLAFEQPVFQLGRPGSDAPLEHPLGPALDGLTTLLTTEELALLVNLPRRESPGVPVMISAEFSLNPPAQAGAPLGDLLEGGEPAGVSYPLAHSTLAKHALVAGITGSGKSTTCRRILADLQQEGVPFLVVEPAKDEYVEWAMGYNAGLEEDDPRRIAVYMPGVNKWRGRRLDELVLNPLDIVWPSADVHPHVLSHIDRLKSILVAAFPMQEVLPILLEEALFTAYTEPVNWLREELPPRTTPRPTLSQLVDQAPFLIRGKGYDRQVTANLTAALMGRLNSLRLGWKRRLFDQPHSTPWGRLFDRPAVINLSHLGDEGDKALAMAIVLQFLHEYRQAQRDAGRLPDRPLGHLTVLEEAHRILGQTSPASVESAHPRAKVAEMFANLLAEIRAYGQGILVVDQVPAKLIPDAVKNTNLKIVHRLVAGDDRDALAAAMGLSPQQAALMNHLRPGQALVYGDQDEMAAWVQVRPQATAISMN